MLDFNQIRATVDGESIEIKLYQLEEMFEKKMDGEEIKDYRHICLPGKKERTLVLRKSGYIDLYVNHKRAISSDESETDALFEYTSLRMNFEACILTRRFRNRSLDGENPDELAEHQVLLNLDQE